jgi:putative transcriptional regulator
MIKSNIREQAEKRGITTAYQLRKRLNISPTGAARLWRGDFEMIGMATLDKLCKLLKCQPGSLLKFEDDGGDGSG